MTKNGYIRLHRKILEWEWYGDINTRLIFFHLLLCANWEDGEIRGALIKRGQLVTTVKELATNNGLTIQQTKTALNHLQTTNEITITATTKFSIITINNFNLYQSDNKPINNQSAKEPQTNQQTNNNQTNKPTYLYKNIKKEKSEEPSASNFNEVKQLFNSICVSLPPIEFDPTAQQVRLVDQARINLRGSSFEDFFKRVEKSDFLCGRNGGWKASFEWILKPENMMKICSGQYDHNYKQAALQNAPQQKSWNNYTPEELEEQAKHFYD